jgi:hypothetical protein
MIVGAGRRKKGERKKGSDSTDLLARGTIVNDLAVEEGGRGKERLEKSARRSFQIYLKIFHRDAMPTLTYDTFHDPGGGWMA